MRRRRLLPPEADTLAAHQAGVLSRRQLLGLGLTSRVIEGLTRDWPRLARGVYLVASSPHVHPSQETGVWAGILLGGDHARAGRTTAAALDGLAEWSEVDAVTILTPDREISPRPGFRFGRESPGVRLASTAREPARTRIEDTVLDLCALAGPGEAVTWLTRACQRRLTTPDRLRRRADGRPALRHRGLVLEILQDVQVGATSHLERHALHDVFRAHGIPGVRLQHRTGTGRIADAAIVAFRVLIEFDGRVGHVEEGAFRDRRRDNAHALEGWVTLRFGWAEVIADPCGVAAQIADLLIRRGWSGPMTRCPRCPTGLLRS